MQVSRTIGSAPGVNAALVAMATELNLELLAGMGFDAPADTGPNDLMVALDTIDDDALHSALELVQSTLSERSRPTPQGFGDTPAARTVGAAAKRAPATVAFVSTPGQYAFADAMDALESDLPVIVFSDNVPLHQEIRLKEEARRRGLLVMGPDCGTAVVGGTGFGFANVVQPGPVGIVAASGTGAQHVMSLVSAAGVGISHCLGVGGRDLTDSVGAISTLTALDMLAADSATELIAVVSKPPAPAVAELVRSHAAELGKPVLFALLGEGQPDLTATAQAIVEAARGGPQPEWTPPRTWAPPRELRPGNGHLRGLFAGGTLCDEAMLIASSILGPVYSNIPLRPDWALGDGLRASGHAMIDFGDDTLTQGRPHPMIDGSLRAERLLAEAGDPDCGVVLLDVVLGHGAHPDPASELAPAIEAARERAAEDGRDLNVVVSLIGTVDDSQDLNRQAIALAGAGASVHLSNAAATREAVRLVGGAT
ncbi:FdrA family protein [Phytoactinopolyspora sp. XMNu-373]|uniref:FdrA family protein n=2 Tax=Phytoactinopolyspora mesophila TaxID=2650750 RepID=A0A7K3LX68_9ACTN|nr:FdrA family protein [Phytoactinopolyspora mesophila]